MAFKVGWRVDRGGDVPAVGQYEPDVATEHLGDAVSRRPGRDVVLGACHEVAVDVDRGQIDGKPSMLLAPGLVSALVMAMSMKLRCSPAGILVASAFQYRMSNAGGVFPCR